MIRLLHIQETIGSGGVERLRLSLSRLMDKNNFELKIICTHTGGGIKEEIEAEGVEVIALGEFKGIFDLNNHHRVQKIIKQYKPHIIHGAVFEGVTMAAINGFIMRVPKIVLEETSDPQNRSWRGNLLMKIFASFSNVVIGVSPGVMDYLENTLKLPKHKVFLLNNGVAFPRKVSDVEKFELKSSLSIEVGDFVVGSVGRMLQDEHKRFSDLIKAFAKNVPAHENIKLLLVGDGPEVKNYKLLAKDLGVLDKIIFTGYQSDVSKFYAIMDVFALVSGYEAFGLVLAEAMLSRLPVIATRVGGMKYIVKDNITGFLVEKYNVDVISDKINELIENKELRLEMGKNGYNRALEKYTDTKYVEDLENFYYNILK